MRLILLLISIGFGNSIIDYWIEQQLKLLSVSPLMISGELTSQNEFSETNSDFEIIIEDKNNFQLKLGSKEIFYSLEATKVYDSSTNQLIIDVPDSNLIRNFSNIFLDKKINIDSNCSNGEMIDCKVKISQYNLFFNVSFSQLDSSITKLKHHFKTTSSEVKDLKIKNIKSDDKKLNPKLDDSFIIDLRP